MAIYSGARKARSCCGLYWFASSPTTIGGLLSAIGIAGIDRGHSTNVMAMSGRAVEAAAT